MVDVQKWRVPEVVHLLGEQLHHCGGSALSIATGRDLVVKARPRDDDAVNVWVDGQRCSAAAIGRCHPRRPRSRVGRCRPRHRVRVGGFADGLVLMVADVDAAPSPDRADECRRASEALGLDRLADAGPDAVLKLDDEVAQGAHAARHHRDGTGARGGTSASSPKPGASSGTILTASHASLRDDFEVSCAELDVAAEAAVEAGALGARMNLALVPPSASRPSASWSSGGSTASGGGGPRSGRCRCPRRP